MQTGDDKHMADSRCLIKFFDIPGQFPLFAKQHSLEYACLRIRIDFLTSVHHFCLPYFYNFPDTGSLFFYFQNSRILQIKINFLPAFVDSSVKLSRIARKFRQYKHPLHSDMHSFPQTVYFFFFSCTFDISNGIIFCRSGTDQNCFFQINNCAGGFFNTVHHSFRLYLLLLFCPLPWFLPGGRFPYPGTSTPVRHQNNQDQSCKQQAERTFSRQSSPPFSNS